MLDETMGHNHTHLVVPQCDRRIIVPMFVSDLSGSCHVVIQAYLNSRISKLEGVDINQCRISLYGRSGRCRGPQTLGAPRTWENNILCPF